MKFFSKSFIYLSTSVLNKAIPFLLLPFLTKYLNPEEYGLVSLFQVVIALLTPAISLGTQINLSKDYINLNKKDFSQYLGNIITLLFFSTLIFFFLLTAGAYLIPGFEIVPFKWLIASPIIVYLSVINTFLLLIFQSEGKPVLFGALEIFKTLINVLLSIYLIYFFSYTWDGRFIGISTSLVITGIISLLIIIKRHNLRFNISKRISLPILKSSIPAVPHYIASFSITFIDRIFIEHMVSIKDLGIYSVGYSLGMIIQLFSDSIIRSWSPWFYTVIKNDNPEVKYKIVRYIYLYCFGMLILSFVLIAVSKIIIDIVIDEAYQNAFMYVPMITFGYLVRSWYQILFPFLIQVKKTHYITISTIIAAVINIILNYLLIAANGTIGAAQSTLISFVVSIGVMFYFVSKTNSIPWIKALMPLLKRKKNV